MTVLTFPWPGSKGAQKAWAFRTRKVQFGEGYAQRGPDGLNSQLRKWSIPFTHLSIETKTAMEAFLVDRKGCEPFFWAAPDEMTVRKWVCASPPTLAPEDDRILWTLQADFEEVP